MEKKLNLKQRLANFLDLQSIDCPSVTQMNFVIGPKRYFTTIFVETSMETSIEKA